MHHSRTIGGMLALAVMLAPAAAAAEVAWKLTQKEGRPYLFAMPTEPEADTLFWALCGKGGAIALGLGGDADVGKGEGEPVAITLKSGGATASIAGRSRKSGNFQMTGTHELRASVRRDHAVFKVLATGEPIVASGSMKAMTWQVKGLKAMVGNFLKACR